MPSVSLALKGRFLVLNSLHPLEIARTRASEGIRWPQREHFLRAVPVSHQVFASRFGTLKSWGTGRGVTIYVVDSGIRKSHQEFSSWVGGTSRAKDGYALHALGIAHFPTTCRSEVRKSVDVNKSCRGLQVDCNDSCSQNLINQWLTRIRMFSFLDFLSFHVFSRQHASRLLIDD